MVQGIKVFRQVQCYRMGVSLFCILFHLLNGVLRASSRTIAVTVLREQRLVDRCKALCYGLLENAVFYGWNTQLSYSTVWLGYLHSSYRVRGVLSPSDSLDKFFLVFPQVCAYFLHGNPVDSWRSLVCLYSLKSSVEVALLQYLLQEFRLCTVPFLPYPAERTVRSHIPFTFRAISLRAAIFVFCTQCSFLLSRLY